MHANKGIVSTSLIYNISILFNDNIITTVVLMAIIFFIMQVTSMKGCFIYDVFNFNTNKNNIMKYNGFVDTHGYFTFELIY